jgi:ABC-type sugar transport system ATPase subunit
MNHDTILEFCDVSKSFPGVHACDHISFDVKRGQVHAIVGENGAGKSTLMKITAGLYQLDDGELQIEGEPAVIRDAQQALQLGIGMVPQELNLVPEMMVAENILLGIEPRQGLGMVDRKELHRRSSEVLASLGIGIDTYQKVKMLSVANQQMVQIARAIANNCKILIMDEPTAPLSKKETDALFERIRHLSELGTTIIYISHRMEEIFEIADRITVLRDGRAMRTMDIADATYDEIVHLMIGKRLDEFLNVREQRKKGGEVVLEARGLSRDGLFEDISFKLHKGEILGFAGLVGARRTETMQSVFGYPPADEGEIYVEGELVEIRRPHDAIQAGIAYLPEERKAQGLFLVMSVLNNVTIPFIKRFQKGLSIRRRDEKEEGKRLTEQLRVQTPSLSQQIRYLSGGNQQKVIVARWLGSGSKILILDEPTRGIDVNAKSEIHGLISDMAQQGESIILVSSELQELLAITDRIMVMREGRIVGEVDPQEVTQEDVLRLAMLSNNGNQKAAAPQVGHSAPAPA